MKFLHGWDGHVANPALDVGGGDPLACIAGGGGQVAREGVRPGGAIDDDKGLLAPGEV